MIGLWIGYIAFGVIVSGLCLFFDGERGLKGGIVATVLCGMPLLISTWRQRVASGPHVPKLSVQRGWIVFPTGMLFRMAWVLGGAITVYIAAGERLSISFWLAILALYLIALVIGVAGEKQSLCQRD